MGNTPTQQPFEGDSSDADESTAGASFRSRVAGAIHSIVDGIRHRVSVFSGLDIGQAFRIEDESFGTSNRLPMRDDENGPASRPRLPQVRPSHTDTLPKRERPLTQPVRDRQFENAPDLKATEEDGHLAIYYPECDDATIVSDTWERVQR